jgi:hypothetical protein
VQDVTVDELSALNSLTKLRTLTLTGEADDPRLDWLSLRHDVMVGTPYMQMIAGTLVNHRKPYCSHAGASAVAKQLRPSAQHASMCYNWA